MCAPSVNRLNYVCISSGEKGASARQSLRIVLEAIILEKWRSLKVEDIRGEDVGILFFFFFFLFSFGW